MSGDYFSAKRAALNGVPYFDYLVGPGYDQIPVSAIYGGFGDTYTDWRSQPVKGRHPKNLPKFRSALFLGHPHDGLNEGYYVFPNSLQAMDLAPDFIQRRQPQINELALSFRSLAGLQIGSELTNGAHVAETDARQRDNGNPIGVLYDPPFLGVPKQGALPAVQPF